MKIPKQIQLMGRTIKIEMKPNLRDERDRLGETHFRADKIIIQSIAEGTQMTIENQKLTLLHESLHWIFHLLHYKKYGDDEALVEQLSDMLLQLIPQIESK